VVCPRHLCRQRHLTAADQPHIRNRMMGGATRLRGHKGRAPAGQAGNAMDARGVDRLGQSHLRQDRREAARQPRGPRPRGTQQEDVMVKTPASASPAPPALHDVLDHVTPPAPPRRAVLVSLHPTGPHCLGSSLSWHDVVGPQGSAPQIEMTETVQGAAGGTTRAVPKRSPAETAYATPAFPLISSRKMTCEGKSPCGCDELQMEEPF
jgi:hypothetical protein